VGKFACSSRPTIPEQKKGELKLYKYREVFAPKQQFWQKKKYGKKNQQPVKNFNKTITSLALFGCEVILTKLAPPTSSSLVIYQLTSIAQSVVEVELLFVSTQ